MIKYTSNAMLATAIFVRHPGSAIGGIDAVDVMRGEQCLKPVDVDVREGRTFPVIE